MTDPDLLRAQVRAWIDAHFDPGMTLRSWLEVLADSGWAAPAWPAAWYGRDLPADQAAVAIAEFGAAGAPGPRQAWARCSSRRRSSRTAATS